MTQRRRTVVSRDQQFVRRAALLLLAWTSTFVIASAGLVVYGDVLLDLFT